MPGYPRRSELPPRGIQRKCTTSAGLSRQVEPCRDCLRCTSGGGTGLVRNLEQATVFPFALAEFPASTHTHRFACKTQASERESSSDTTTRRLHKAGGARTRKRSVSSRAVCSVSVTPARASRSDSRAGAGCWCGGPSRGIRPQNPSGHRARCAAYAVTSGSRTFISFRFRLRAMWPVP